MNTHKYTEEYNVCWEISSHIWAAGQCNNAHEGHNPETQTTRALRDRILHLGQNLIQYLNLDFWINADPDICRIALKMYWIHSLVGVSHFVKYRKIVR